MTFLSASASCLINARDDLRVANLHVAGLRNYHTAIQAASQQNLLLNLARRFDLHPLSG